jgi:hypothetical protein
VAAVAQAVKDALAGAVVTEKPGTAVAGPSGFILLAAKGTMLEISGYADPTSPAPARTYPAARRYVHDHRGLAGLRRTATYGTVTVTD